MKITAKVMTKLKKKPIASTYLIPTEFIDVPVGKTYEVTTAIAAKANHTQIDLAFNAGNWFVFNEHWDGLNTQVVSKATAEYIFERAVSDELLADLNCCLNQYEITTPRRLRPFLSQIGTESGGLQYMLEIWGPTPDQLAYEWDEGLGNVRLGDGKKHRGAGLLQVTGKRNQAAFGNEIGDPEVERQGAVYIAKKYPSRISGFWWTRLNNMNALCDRGASCEEVSRMVNLGGGAGEINGLRDRQRYYERCCNVIGDSSYA